MLCSSDSFLALSPPSPTNLSCSRRVRTHQCAVKQVTKVKCITSHKNHRTRYGGFIPSILESLERVHDLNQAFKPWKRLSSKERTVILKEQTDWRRALEIFNWFKKHTLCGVNLIHYNVVLRIVGKAQRFDLLVNLWCEMHDLGLVPSNSTYTPLIEAYSKKGGNRAMLIWVGDMYKRGIEPDETTVVSIFKSYTANNGFVQGEQVFCRWVANRENSPELQQNCSLYTCNVLMGAYVKSGMFEKALDVFCNMIKGGTEPDTVSYNTLIHACGKRGMLKEVPKFVSAVSKLNCIPDAKSHVSIISLCIKSGYVMLAESYFSTVKGKSVLLDILGYRKLLYEYAKLKMVEKAETLLGEIEERGIVIDEYTQSTLIKMYVNIGLLRKAWSWFEKFADFMSSNCLSANIDAFGESGFISLAERAFIWCLENKKAGVCTFNVMIKAYGVGKEYEKACELVDCMEERYNLSPDSCTYNTLILILSGAQLADKAIIYTRKMYDAGLVRSCFSYSVIIGCYVKLGNVEMAEKLFNEMLKLNIQIDMIVYSMLIDAYAGAGNVEMAKKYLTLLRTAGFKVNLVICNSLLKLYTKAGRLLEAVETYHLLQSFHGTGKPNNPYASNCMLSLYSDNSMVNEAEEIFTELRKNKTANEFSYVTMLLLYKRLGRFKEAFEISTEMQSLGFPNESFGYNAVINLYGSLNRAKGAVRVFSHMVRSNVRPDNTTFRLLRCIMAECGVEKKEIRRMERIRRRDGEVGLREWVKVINSVVVLDDVILENSMNLSGGGMKKDRVVKKLKREGNGKEVMAPRDLLYV